MPVRSLILPIEHPFRLNPLGEFYRRCFYHSLDSDLRAGRSMTTTYNGKIISAAEARRRVAYARAQGWLPTRVRKLEPAAHPRPGEDAAGQDRGPGYLAV